MDWRALFEEKVLETGYKLFKEGKVTIIHENLPYIEGNVDGHQVYVDLDHLRSLQCDCQDYLKKSENCAHLAALLWYVDEQFYDETALEDTFGALLVTLDTLATDQLKEAILYLLAKNPENATYLQEYFIKSLNMKIDEIKEYIDEIFVDFEDDHEPFIGDQVENVFTSFFNDYFSKESYDEAFEIIKHVFDHLMNYEHDDEEGKVFYIYPAILTSLTHLLDLNETSLNNHIFNYLMAKVKTAPEGALEVIEEVLFEYLMKEPYLDRIEKYIQSIIKRLKTKKEIKTHGYYFYAQAKLLKSRNQLEELNRYLVSFWDQPLIRDYATELALDNKNIDRAIEIIKESQKMDSRDEHTWSKRQIWLVDILKHSSRVDMYRYELLQLVVRSSYRRLENYLLLKDMYSKEEWNAAREFILSALKNQNHEDVALLYIEEKMFGQLLNYVLKSNDMRTILSYSKYLRKDYESLLLSKYNDLIVKMLQSHENNDEQIKHYLKMIRDYENGNQWVELHILEWKKEFPNRKKLWESVVSFQAN